MCDPLHCPIYADGWCEYDFATGWLMPHDPEKCPMNEKEDLKCP